MTNKDRKKKVIKWLLIGVGCIVVFFISGYISYSIAVHNKQEYMMHGGIAADPASINIIPKNHPLQIAAGWGGLLSLLGAILSAIMFIISAISWWVNSSPSVVQQVTTTNSDTLIQLSNLYKEGLITKEEFEGKKKQLLR